MPVIRNISYLNTVSDTDIDTSGDFQYVLIKIQVGDSGPSKTIVRGYSNCDSHAKVLKRAQKKIEKKNVVMECIGGGFIKHEKKKLYLYGYSKTYGKANHEMAATILKKKYPEYDITFE